MDFKGLVVFALILVNHSHAHSSIGHFQPQVQGVVSLVDVALEGPRHTPERIHTCLTPADTVRPRTAKTAPPKNTF